MHDGPAAGALCREMIEVCKTDGFAIGECRIVHVKGREIGVIHLRRGTYRAVLNRCPHRGAPICRGRIDGTWAPSAPCTLEFVLEGQTLTCPWHGLEFDLNTGRELYRSRPTRLQLFETSVVAGVIHVFV